jgi:5-methylcytosine-specific restriction endonuclease McrA
MRNPTTKRCFYCEREFGQIPINSNTPLRKTFDHILPVSKGGRFHPFNIIPACNKCNSFKSNLTLEEFEKLIDTWIEAGYQTRKGYTQSDLITIKSKIRKLHSVLSGYIVACKLKTA